MDNFSNLMMIGECLLDRTRVELFRKAIFSSVKKGDIVLDSGTGSGILAMLSAQAGAKKVYAVENNEDVANIARENIRTNNLHNVIEVLNVDIKDLQIPGQVDIVTMEMLDTGLISEQQVIAMNTLLEKGFVTSKTKIIPSKVETYLQLVNYDFNFYGFDLPFVIQARNFGVMGRIKEKLSERHLMDSVDLATINTLDVSKIRELVSTVDGIANAIVMTSDTFLTPTIKSEGTSDMNMPVIIPIKDIPLHKGDVVKLSVKYKMSYGFDTFEVVVL